MDDLRHLSDLQQVRRRAGLTESSCASPRHGFHRKLQSHYGYFDLSHNVSKVISIRPLKYSLDVLFRSLKGASVV